MCSDLNMQRLRHKSETFPSFLLQLMTSINNCLPDFHRNVSCQARSMDEIDTSLSQSLLSSLRIFRIGAQHAVVGILPACREDTYPISGSPSWR